MKSKPAFKKALVATLATLIVFILCMSIAWGFSSSWGQVKITSVSFTGDDGLTYEGKLWIPANATAENPAPAVINFHGLGSVSEVEDNWALEQARRGFVVFNPDYCGSPYGDTVATTMASAAQADQGNAHTFFKYIDNLNFVDSQKITVTGYSYGAWPAIELINNYSDQIPAIITVSSDLFGLFFRDTNVNACWIVGHSDQLANYDNINVLKGTFGLGADSTNDTIVGDFGEKSARQFIFVDRMIHWGGVSNKTAMTGMLNFLMQSVDAPVALSADDHVYSGRIAATTLATVTLLLFIGAFGWLLIECPLFADVKNPLPQNIAPKGKQFVLLTVAGIALYMATFLPLSTWGTTFMQTTSVFGKMFPLERHNGTFVWLFVMCVISFAAFLIYHFKTGKQQGYGLDTYGLAPSGSKKLSWKLIGKSFVISAIVVFCAEMLVMIVRDVTGMIPEFTVEYHFFGINKERFLVSIPYMFIWLWPQLVTMFTNSTFRRLQETGDEKKDTLRMVLFSGIMSAIPTGIFLVIKLGTQILTNEIGLSVVEGTLGFSLTMPFVFFYVGALGEWFYRKTGNVYVGAFICTLLMAIQSAMGFAIWGIPAMP